MLIVILCDIAVDDLERNDGSADKPYFMNKELLKILGKRNEKYKEVEEKVQPADKKPKKNRTEATGVWLTDVETVKYFSEMLLRFAA